MIPTEIINIFNAIHPLAPEVMTDIAGCLHEKTIRKKEILLKTGQTSKHIYFIKKGLLRSYITEHDTETTIWFMGDHDFVVSVKSFYKQVPSSETIEALEQCTMYYISYEDLNRLFATYHSFALIGIYLTQHYYISSEERLLILRKKDPGERYEYLLEKHPQIFNRCAQHYIASFLGMTPETVSRIRAKKK